jgi:E1A/CREB-binding protein
MNNSDSFGSGNFYGAATSVGSMMNTQNLSSVSLPSISKTNSSLISNQSNLQGTQQAAYIKPSSVDQSEKMNFQASMSSRDNLLHSHQQQQFQHQSHQFQPQQQFVQQQRQQKQQSQQHQHMLNNDTFGQSQLTSDIGSQVKREPGVEHHNEVLNSQVSEQFQLSEMQNQFQQNSAEDRSRSAQQLSLPSAQHDICSSLSQNSQQMQQLLHQNQLVTDSQSDYSCLSVGTQPESVLQGQWHPQSQDRNRVPSIPLERHVQEDFRQRLSRQDEAQCNNLSSEGSIIGRTAACRSSTEPPNLSGDTCRSGIPSIDRMYRNQQRWLLFLQHARRCTFLKGKCPSPQCVIVQELLLHIGNCNLASCMYPRCHHTKGLIDHHKKCRTPSCPVCVPVRKFILRTRLNAHSRTESSSCLPTLITASCKSYDTGDNSARLISKTSSVVETSEELQPSLKRLKIEQPSQSLIPESESSAVSVSAFSEPHGSQDVHLQDNQHDEICLPVKPEFPEVKKEIAESSGLEILAEMKKDDVNDNCNQRPDSESIPYNEPSGLSKQENIKLEKENDPAKQENVTQPAEHAAGTKSGKPKIKGVSLTELFTPEQVREHIQGLRQWVGQVSFLEFFIESSLIYIY